MKNLLKKQFQNRCVFYQYFPSMHHIYKNLQGEPYEVQFYQLENIARQLRVAGNHKGYNLFLKEFVPEWDMTLDDAEFIGHGIGRDGFNTYRKVEINREILFEKILMSFKPHIVGKALWLQESFFGRLDKCYMNVPALKQCFRGEVITIMYYDYMSLPKISTREVVGQAVMMSKYLYELSFEKPGPGFDKIPGFLYELSHIRRYRTRIDRVKRALKDKGINIETIEGRLRKGRLVYTHLDIKGLNMFKQDTLIDWDEFGIFPAGMEQANIYFRNILWYTPETPSALIWLQKHFKLMVPKGEWPLFQLSFLYFLYIFAFKFLQKPAYARLKQELIQNMKNDNSLQVKV